MTRRTNASEADGSEATIQAQFKRIVLALSEEELSQYDQWAIATVQSYIDASVELPGIRIEYEWCPMGEEVVAWIGSSRLRIR